MVIFYLSSEEEVSSPTIAYEISGCVVPESGPGESNGRESLS